MGRLYHPDGDPSETLELGNNENEMAEAIEKLMRVVGRRRPKPGRLRIIASINFTCNFGVKYFGFPLLFAIIPKNNSRS